MTDIKTTMAASTEKKDIKALCNEFQEKLAYKDYNEVISTSESLKLLYEDNKFPYEEKLNKKKYNKLVRLLQIELVKMQRHVIDQGLRIVVVCEGRDTAGKGGAIKRFTEHLNPRYAKVVALPKPNDVERGQWYFQRYISHLPTAGEIIFYDRSWYNRAGVERVMGFCDDQELESFYQQVPAFEKTLVESGTKLIKFWFSIEQLEQLRRFHERMRNPLKRWKLSAIDLESLDKWKGYTKARNEMMKRTDTKVAPWTTINSNDKLRARLTSMQYLLQQVDYTNKDYDLITSIDTKMLRKKD